MKNKKFGFIPIEVVIVAALVLGAGLSALVASTQSGAINTERLQNKFSAILSPNSGSGDSPGDNPGGGATVLTHPESDFEFA